ncbi:MAG: 16S rRNA (adenine(1518)-N(6)/adenine(1519)-N(6))-dimethyltransferase RsmA [Solobacterium sp.]|nr:16S rRNA (adenine(1518)-N(6)/adenine(1519)-N(6))-dimethyltransferase RsmA [Solobacterium sp.]
MNKPIAAPSRTKEILQQFGLHAKKGYGQNFLTDVSVVSRCAQVSHCEGAVIEIGPGIGSLTEQLALCSKHVRAYEVDEKLIPVLKETLKEYGNVEVILQDFLEADVESSVRELREAYGSVAVCANLPYYITTPILFRLFECREGIPYITVMVQKEVADRFAAEPGSKDYGALSVESQYLYDVKKLYAVPRNSFQPAPNVDSAVIQFRQKEIDDPVDDREAFFELVKACFKQRRKTIYNNVREYLGNGETAVRVLREADIDPGCRAQELGQKEFRRLYERTCLCQD